MGGWKRKRLEALDDEDLHDVYLVGTDGEEVGCCKSTLAAQSPMFKSMFFKGFREQKADRCKLGFHSVVIRMVVKFCHCGDSDISETTRGYAATGEQEAELVVEVLEAGTYFELEELRLEAEREIGQQVFDKSRGHFGNRCYKACAYLTELFKRGEDHGPLWSALVEFAVQHAVRCFGHPRVGVHPHASVLVKVLEKTYDMYDTFTVVKCLQAWFIRESKNARATSDEEKQALVDFSKTVDLKRLSTSQLTQLFSKRSCALFPSDRILEAFFHHSQGQEMQPSTSRSMGSDTFYVSGAGKECLNGFYKRLDPRNSKVFFMDGHDDDLFIIHYRSSTRKWLLSVTETDYVDFDDNGDVLQDFIFLDAYEAKEDGDSVPFNSWSSVAGGFSSPIIARIDG